jgi:exodeoxyribonuclease V alpha subunit
VTGTSLLRLNPVLGDICDQYHSNDYSENFCGLVKQLIGVPLNAPDVRILPVEGLHDSIVTLHKNYRFSETGGIGGFSCEVKSGNAAGAAELLIRTGETGIIWEEASSPGTLQAILERSILKAYTPYLQTAEPVAALEKFNNFQILCVLNKGPFGIQAVNQLSEQILTRNGFITADHRSQHSWYRGRPVIITRNDYRLGLYNGDIGITLPDPKDVDDTLYVFFPGPHGETKRFIPHQLPEHETVYAMTVHKSQGSEFAKILLILPDEDVTILTRELIYTAVTRAKEQVVICGGKPILHAAVSRRIDRTSGLRDALWH